MNKRFSSMVAILAVFGAASGVKMLSTSAHAQQAPPPRQRMRGPNNMTATTSLTDAVKTATGKTSGFVNAAQLTGPPDKLVWRIHVVTSPAKGDDLGKGENVFVDGSTGAITDAPPAPVRPPGGGGGGGVAATAGGGGATANGGL